MKIIITMPAYNEEKTIGDVIRNINQVMKKTKHKYEVIVVDDASTDKTALVAKKAGALVHSHPYKSGLAETFRTEMSIALKKKGEVIVHIDADDQYSPEEIPKLINPIMKKEADLVMGSRFLGTIEEMPFIKKLGNKAFSRVISGVTDVKITDSQTGFRAFTKDVAEKINIISKHTYTQEMVIKAIKEKFKIKEIPIYFAKRKHGKSRLLANPFEYAIKAWINIFRIYRDYAPLKFFGILGTFLIFVSFILGLYILNVFFILGAAGPYQKLPTILLMLLLFVTGIQILIFGFLADMKK